jgi:hypothetical protein
VGDICVLMLFTGWNYTFLQVRRPSGRRSGGHRDYQEQVYRLPVAALYGVPLRRTQRSLSAVLRNPLDGPSEGAPEDTFIDAVRVDYQEQVRRPACPRRKPPFLGD